MAEQDVPIWLRCPKVVPKCCPKVLSQSVLKCLMRCAAYIWHPQNRCIPRTGALHPQLYHNRLGTFFHCRVFRHIWLNSFSLVVMCPFEVGLHFVSPPACSNWALKWRIPRHLLHKCPLTALGFGGSFSWYVSCVPKIFQPMLWEFYSLISSSLKLPLCGSWRSGLGRLYIIMPETGDRHFLFSHAVTPWIIDFLSTSWEYLCMKET